jgi:hypothetical protein
MLTIEKTVRQYLTQFMAKHGIEATSVYDATNDAWYFRRGSATLEVFFVSYQTAKGETRTFIRFFSPLATLPEAPQTQWELLYQLTVLNSQYMGVKFALLPEKPYIYAIYERDIDGMSYEEFELCMEDSGYWGDYLDDEVNQFIKKISNQ